MKPTYEQLLLGKRNAKILSGEAAYKPKVMKHEEADLHLAFCKWVRLQYPKLQFIRHEREKKRSPFLQNLFKIYNSDNDKMPDFELLEPSHVVIGYTHPPTDTSFRIPKYVHMYHRLYIEFKKPRTTLTLRDGKTIKSEYSEQYRRHIAFWEQNSPAYFCSDLLEAQELLRAYLSGNPLPMQVFNLPPSP